MEIADKFLLAMSEEDRRYFENFPIDRQLAYIASSLAGGYTSTERIQFEHWTRDQQLAEIEDLLTGGTMTGTEKIAFASLTRDQQLAELVVAIGTTMTENEKRYFEQETRDQQLYQIYAATVAHPITGGVYLAHGGYSIFQPDGVSEYVVP